MLVRLIISLTLLAILPANVAAENFSKRSEETVLIILSTEALINKKHYMIKDIAKVETRDIKTGSFISEIVVGRSPRVGSVSLLNRDRLTARIENEKPGIYERILWKGAATVKVKTVGRTLDADEYEAFAADYLNSWLSKRFDKYRIKRTGRSKDLLIPHGVVKLVSENNTKLKLNKRMNVWVDIAVNDERYQSVPVWFSVEAFAPVNIVVEDMKRGKQLGINNTLTSISDIAGLGSRPVIIDDTNSLRLVRSIKAGDILTEREVEQVPDVLENQSVKVQAKVGNIIVLATAVSEKDGKTGDYITVKKPDSDIRYQAKVIGKGLLSVTGE